MLILVALFIATPVSLFVMKNWLMTYAFRTDISLWVYFASGLTSISIGMLSVSWQSWGAANRNMVEALR